MRGIKRNAGKWMCMVILAIAAIFHGSSLAAQTAADPQAIQLPVQRQATTMAPGSAPARRILLVSIPDRELALLEDGAVKRVYSVAVGKASTPSPSGDYTIVRRVSDPTYAHHGKVVAPGPHNPVGSRWIGLSVKGYGIHGTNEPGSIGKAASHGCVRMGKADLEELYSLVQVGDVVEIHAERHAAVNQALWSAPATAPTAPPVSAMSAVLVAGNAPGGDAQAGNAQMKAQQQ
jgi:lipoprotein-anchoring transpeptidase ErfK/SrfK